MPVSDAGRGPMLDVRHLANRVAVGCLYSENSWGPSSSVTPFQTPCCGYGPSLCIPPSTCPKLTSFPCLHFSLAQLDHLEFYSCFLRYFHHHRIWISYVADYRIHSASHQILSEHFLYTRHCPRTDTSEDTLLKEEEEGPVLMKLECIFVRAMYSF